MEVCSICKTNKAIETHHKTEQYKANKHGFIGSMHKNNLSNLLPLCEECHSKLHSEEKFDKDSDKDFELVKKLKADGKSQASIAKELNITLYKVQKMLKKV